MLMSPMYPSTQLLNTMTFIKSPLPFPSFGRL